MRAIDLTLKRLVTAGAAAALVLAIAPIAGAQVTSPPTAPGSIAQKGEMPAAPPLNAPQGAESHNSLVISPQVKPAPATEDIPGGRNYRRSREDETLDRLSTGALQNQVRTGPKPYLGISVKYTTTCFLGKEEDGLEVVEVDPNSPAARAGLRGPQSATMLGATAATAGSLLGPVGSVVDPLLARKHMLGLSGDLIVAVDGHRVRTQQDLENQMAQMKPGDTMYLDVLRPLVGGGHRTMHLTIKLGREGESYANAAPAAP